MDLSGKRVMVTGGAGFIGSTLVRELISQGAQVVVLDNFYSGSESNLTDVLDKIKIIRGDIRDSELQKMLVNEGIEYLFNLAAEPFIPRCYERPTRFFEINANGTLNVLMACKEAGVKRIVHYSSSEVYGGAKTDKMDESHPTLPLSTYAVSKLASDRLCYTLHHEQEIPVVILRQFNVYGPRETHPYIIPELITQLNKSNKLKLGNIKASRDLTFVTDAAKASAELIKTKEAEGEAINVGAGRDYTVEELANQIGKLMGHDSIEIETEKSRLRPLDVERLCCDASKMKKLTGWEPTVDLETGLKHTIDNFHENGDSWIWESRLAPEEEVWKEK